MKKLFILVAVLFSTATLGSGQQMPPLPADPAVRVGKLDNGLTYYIRHNDKPAQRAEFYLATNVGAIQETPDQDGLAHFLEHMCFNGTKNFPGKGILNYLESIGASFGGNVNASTGVEQTIYLLNNIPIVRETVIDSCILIMHDYSHFVTLDPAEIDAERGVILEEKRSRNDASWRVREKAGKYLYGDTKYADCTVIGSEENLRTFKPESLENFYRTWYHPDMQALVVVGDVDADYVENVIKRTFADIPPAENPKAKDVITIPALDTPAVGIITDPELTSSTIEVYWEDEALPEYLNNTQVGFVTELVKDIISTIMNERFSDISSKPGAPFLNAGIGIGELCETCEAVYTASTFKDGEVATAFEAMLTEMEKMKRFGFTDDEVQRAKDELLSQYESNANKAETRKNSEFVMPLINNFFDNKPYMEPATELEIAKVFLAQIDASSINQMAAQVLSDNMVILYTAPEREGLVHPTEAQLLEVVEKVSSSEIARNAGEELPSEFISAKSLKGSKVARREAYKYGSELITLKNGVRVVLLPVDYEKDRISLSLTKKGGQSIIPDADMASFESNILNAYTNNTGVGAFSKTTVGKMLSGKQVNAAPFIGSYTHGISANSTTKDAETMLQLVYLYFTQPRFDAYEFQNGIDQLEAILPSMVRQSNYKLQKAIYENVFTKKRSPLISEESVKMASLPTIERVYRNTLFKDAAGTTVYIVGDFDKEEMLALVQKYIGSLPKGKKAADWAYLGDGFVSSSRTVDFKAEMQTPMVTVLQCYISQDKPYSMQTEVNYDALAYILNMVYTETLRENEGGTYGASAVAEVSNEPYEYRIMQVVFQTNEESADKLRTIAVDGLKELAVNGPTAEHFDKTVKNLEKNIPESRIRNSYWAGALSIFDLNGVDTDAEREAAVKALTPEMIRQTAKELLESANVELVMRPE